MNEIEAIYTINPQTLALLPAKQINYDTTALEYSKTINVRQTALYLISQACRDDWTTYEGRRKAVISHMNFKQKTPIPVSLHKRIYLFPTHSPKSAHNIWIAYLHIAKTTLAPQYLRTKGYQTIIHFKNRQILPLTISMHTLKSQMQRTFECMCRVEEVIKGYLITFKTSWIITKLIYLYGIVKII